MAPSREVISAILAYFVAFSPRPPANHTHTNIYITGKPHGLLPWPFWHALWGQSAPSHLPIIHTHTHARTHIQHRKTPRADLSNSDILCVAFSPMSPTATQWHTHMYSTEKHQGLWPRQFWHTLCSIQPHVTYCHTHTHVQHRKTPRAVTSAFLTYFVQHSASCHLLPHTHACTAQKNTKGCDLSISDILCVAFSPMSPTAVPSPTPLHTHTHTHVQQRKTPRAATAAILTYLVQDSAQSHLLPHTHTHTHTVYNKGKHLGLWPQPFWHTLCNMQPQVTNCHRHTGTAKENTNSCVSSNSDILCAALSLKPSTN